MKMLKPISRTTIFVFISLFVAATTKAQINCSQAGNKDKPECNCVKYARSQVSNLPGNLNSLDQKKAIRNHAFPRVGSVAIHDIFGTIGHVSVVRNVSVGRDGNLSVTVQEGNYERGKITTRNVRNISEIVGYFDPSFGSGNRFQELRSISKSSGTAGTAFDITAYGADFESNSVQAIILGGWCDTFAKCVIPNNVMRDKSASQLTFPISINNPGSYTIYIYDPRNGKSSNGKQISIR